MKSLFTYPDSQGNWLGKGVDLSPISLKYAQTNKIAMSQPLLGLLQAGYAQRLSYETVLIVSNTVATTYIIMMTISQASDPLFISS